MGCSRATVYRLAAELGIDRGGDLYDELPRRTEMTEREKELLISERPGWAAELMFGTVPLWESPNRAKMAKLRERWSPEAAEAEFGLAARLREREARDG